MRTVFLHILLFVLIAALPGCRNDDVLPERASRTLTLHFGVTGYKPMATDGPSVLYLWVYDTNKMCIQFLEVRNPEFTQATDGSGKYVGEQTVELPEGASGTLQLYGVLNYAPSSASFSKETTISELENIAFSRAEEWTSAYDYRVPMSGKLDINLTATGTTYTLNLKRAVAKIDVYVAKNDAATSVKINSITLHGAPSQSYLLERPLQEGASVYPSGTVVNGDINLNLAAGGVSVDEVITDDNLNNSSLADYFGQHPASMQQLQFDNPYLLEKCYSAATDDPLIVDDVYREMDRYCLKIIYKTGEINYTRYIYLPNIPRNLWYTLLIRFRNGMLHINWLVRNWEDGGTLAIGGGVHPTTIFQPYKGSNGNAWYVKDADMFSPDAMSNAARYLFDMQSEHQWNVSCSNVADFGYKVFKRDGTSESNYTYTDVEKEGNVSKTNGTYIICVYPRYPLGDVAPACKIELSYYNTYFGRWEKLPGDATSANITQIPVPTDISENN